MYFFALLPNRSNGWPPLHELIVTGLEQSEDPEAKDLALEVVRRWVKNNWVSYVQSGEYIFEKYDVSQVGLPGGGGEYDVQEGFGWTNGVLLTFFDRYGQVISSDDQPSAASLCHGKKTAWLIILCVVVSWYSKTSGTTA